MKANLLLVFILSSAALRADDVSLDWMASGFSAKTGYYKPVRAALSGEKPSIVDHLPEGVSGAEFGTLLMGPGDKPAHIALLIDERDDGTSKLWVDSNANGDLTDDPPTVWTPRKTSSGTTWSGSANVVVDYGTAKRTLGLKLYRFDKNDPNRKELAASILYYRDYGWTGQVKMGEKAFKAMLTDDSSRGDYTGSDSALMLDVNDDGRIDFKSERFATSKPFNVAGTTYEVTGVKADGSQFQIVKSTKAVAEKVVPPSLGIGSKPIAFEDKTIDGKAVKFPNDYKGKLVMLDFWATWCGPCIAELPNLTKVYQQYHSQGFEVLGISLDSEASIKKLPAFLKDKGMSWPQVCDGQGWDSRIAGLYGVRGIPACFLVDGNTGLIVATSRELRGSALSGTVEKALANLGKGTKSTSLVTPSPTKNEAPDDPVAFAARKLADAGKLIKADTFSAQLTKQVPGLIALPPASTIPLRGRQIAERASAAHVRFGWVYQCTKCSRWHTKLAGGYAIATDVVATAFHVASAPTTMRPGTGSPIIVLGNTEVHPITAVLAADELTDTAIVRVSDCKLSPLPLSGDARVGDTAYCFSDPRGVRNFFSTGIVNRFFSRTDGPAGDPRLERVNISTDWAPGSSGSAVLDECGNVIGHVARIQPLSTGKSNSDGHDDNPATVMTINEAVPAKNVLRLLEKMKSS